MNTENTITFDTYTKVETYLFDKNDVYRYKFYAANCDPNKMDEVDSMDNDTINKNVALWGNLMTINPTQHESIEGIKLKKILSEITTQDWVHITTLIDNADKLPSTYMAIFQYLCKNEIDIDKVKELDHRKPMEHISFFLQNYNKLMNYSLIYSHPQASKNLKSQMEMLMENLHRL